MILLLHFIDLKKKNFSLSAKIYRSVFESIPILGIPVALVYPVWKIMRALCLLAALYGHDVTSEEVQQKILMCFASSSSSSTVAVQASKPIAVQAVNTATKAAVLPEVTSVLATKAATNYITTGIKFVSTQGSEVVVEQAGSFFAGKFGGMATKFIATKTGLVEVLNGVTTSIGNQIITKGVPNVVTNKVASTAAVQTSIASTATIASYSIASVVIIPLNLFLGWIMDNSEEIFKNARLQFVPQSSTEELMSDFEILDKCDNEDESFQILESISFLSALPEPEAGQGYFFSWYKTELQLNSNFFVQQWALSQSAYRVVCKHFRSGFIVPLISCGTLEDAEYIVEYVQKNVENKLNYDEFLESLNKNENYLKELISSSIVNK